MLHPNNRFIYYVAITDLFITWCRCAPSLRQGHKSKKRNTDATDLTRIGLFTDLFFDFIELLIIGFWFGFIWI